eukprot:CAMPEP_0118870680 /NCGR_PEP_ID=MMETSP1163-20130328/13552_1 /TAXON_ID=124430 /ORGANISM="Phaeomonas parva, Strain CCMP2877" /LENGTH=59 /DNA_ID=CAMNT_0006805703 /DNA_START=56 /DNA_END=235 /DNA_ORIENTATION=-
MARAGVLLRHGADGRGDGYDLPVELDASHGVSIPQAQPFGLEKVLYRLAVHAVAVAPRP